MSTLSFIALLSVAPPLWARSILDPSTHLAISPITAIAYTFSTSLFIMSCGAFFLLHTSIPPRPTFFLFTSSSFDPIFSWFYYFIKTAFPDMQSILRRPLFFSFFILGYYTWFLLCCYLAHVIEGDKRETWLELPPNWMNPWRYSLQRWGSTHPAQSDDDERDLEKGCDVESACDRVPQDSEPDSYLDSDSDDTVIKVGPNSPSIV